MKKQAIEDRKQRAGEKHPSMKRRDDHQDYTERRMYMLTLEVEGRQPLLGRVVGDPAVPSGQPGAPAVELTELGLAVLREWEGIPRYYPQISILGGQVMPDHFHGIIFVRERIPVHLGKVVNGFKVGCNRALRAQLQQGGSAAARPNGAAAAQPLPTEKGAAAAGLGAPAGLPAAGLASPQAAATPQQQRSGVHLWARGYNDLILRSYDELGVWKNYLQNNPRRLLLRQARPELLRPRFGLRLGSHVFAAIGNVALLAAPRRVAVRVSRRLAGADLQRVVDGYLAAARDGAVLVSPSISPGEKQVMRTAFDAHLPTIVIMPNGFTPLTKPHGEQFYACAAGRLLMLAPWEHHNERRPLTAQQCQQMNLMALELCEDRRP